MTHSTKTRIRTLGAALIVGLAAFGVSRSAKASSNYPPALAAALNAQFQTCSPDPTDPTGVKMICKSPGICVPLCTACHNTTAGGPGDLNVWGQNLMTYGTLGQKNAANVGPAIKKYFATTPPADQKQTADHQWDADGDGISDEMEILGTDSPSLPNPRGQNQFCPDIKYGCAGGRIASAPARDDKPAFFAAALVVVGLSAAMRRRRRRAQPRS
ncbi:MAG: hypothetical protein ABI488_00975 [Polyangiaceae bacterium]